MAMANFNNNSNIKYKQILIPNLIINTKVNTDIIEIEDDQEDQHSSIINTSNETSLPHNVNDITIIDITNISHKVCETTPYKIPEKHTECNNNNDIIDITNTTINNTVNGNAQSEFSNSYSNNYISIGNSQINCTTGVKIKPMEIITISDDEEEKTHQPTITKSDKFVSIKEHYGSFPFNCSRNTLKRKCDSVLYNRKKACMDRNMNTYRPNFGTFKRQRIPYRFQNRNITEYRSAAINRHSKYTSDMTKVTTKKLRPIIIDGLNIGHKHGCGTFSAKGIDLCIEYFANRGHRDIIAFIPEHRQGPPRSESHSILSRLEKKGHICFTPSRKVQNIRMTCYDDRILLNYAHKCGGVVVSNDYFRDLYRESEEFKDIIQNRQVMVTFARDEIIVPEDQYNRKNYVRSLSDILIFPA